MWHTKLLFSGILSAEACSERAALRPEMLAMICSSWWRHRTTHQAGVVLLTAVHNNLQQPACWLASLPAADSRCLSTQADSHVQQAASSSIAGADPAAVQSSIAQQLSDVAAVHSSSSSTSLLGSLATSGSSSSSSSIDAGTSLTQLFADAGTMGSSFAAAQPLEPLWQVINPIVMGCSAWEMMHSATGLPWWISIPLTTLTMRTLLLPLTLKAKSAGLNFVLAQQATQTATNLLDHWKQAQAQAQQAGGSSSSSSSGSSSAAGFGLGGSEELKRPSRWRLSRMYYRYYRKQHGTTSLWWWSANIFTQLNLFLAMSQALRTMSEAQWPGFTDQGFWVITDLTQPVVVLGSQALLSGAYCPYGFAGFLMPAALLYMYRKTVQDLPLAQRSPTFSAVMDLPMLPILLSSTVFVPQATLLYWLSNSAFFLGLQKALAEPRIAAALRLPAVMMPHPRHDKEARERAELEAMRAQQLVCGSEDVGFLRYLAASYVSRGMHQQALQCLQRLTMLSPGNADAFRALGNSAAEEQQWIVSARAFERAAELGAVAVDRQEHVECLMLAAKQWLNATAEARAMQRRKQRKQQQQQQHLQQGGFSSQQVQRPRDAAAGAAAAAGTAAVGDTSADASSSSDSSSAVDEKVVQPVQPGEQQAYINSALELLQQAIHFQQDGAADAYYLLSMALAADGKWEPSYKAATTFWTRSLALAENDQSARINAAAKLLPVLDNLVSQCWKQQDFSALVTLGQLAVEVAKCGWDRQTEEQLRDTLGAAVQAAKQQGKKILAQQIAELQQQLPCGVVRRSAPPGL